VVHATRHAIGIKNQLHAINATNGFTQLVVMLWKFISNNLNLSLGLWWFILLGDDAAVGSHWNQKSVACDKCDQWFHTACMGISTSMYETLEIRVNGMHRT
jgi:hypothetical protein